MFFKFKLVSKQRLQYVLVVVQALERRASNNYDRRRDMMRVVKYIARWKPLDMTFDW